MEMKGVGSWASSRLNEFRTGLETGKRMGRLGLSRRIATASDDPGGAGIASRMRARAYAFRATRENTSRGMDLARTTGGALGSIGGDLERMRELGMQAASGTLSDGDRANLDAEFQSLKDGIGDQLGGTFGGLGLFSGDSVSIASDPDGEAPIELKLPDGADLASVQALDVASVASAQAALSEIDGALDAVAGMQAELGAGQAALASAYQGQAETEMQLARAESRIADADVARETSGLAAAQIMEHATLALQLHGELDSKLVGDLLSAPF